MNSKLVITVDLSAEVEELKSLITQFLDRGTKLPQHIIRALRRTLSRGPTEVFEYCFNNIPAARAGEFSLVLHLNNNLRKIMLALRAVNT